VAIARQQGEIEALHQRVGWLEEQMRSAEAEVGRRHAELRDDLQRGLDAQAAALERMTARLDGVIHMAGTWVPPEVAQRLAASHAREAAARAWAIALLGALAALAAAVLANLKH